MKWIPATIAGKLTMAALVALAVTEGVSVFILEGELPPVALIIMLVLLALAALVATGRWWAFALAALLGGLLSLLTLVGGLDRLTNPGDPAFLSALIFLSVALVAAIAGVWSAVEARRPV
ncbi:MAG: hypothetical protein R3335_00740 [Anaerolineales bacterium]|nr:hypothetical protein [Anaerolineales bacterium]